MKSGKSVIVFFLEGYRYGIPLDLVERAAPVVEITPVPDAPDSIFGIINVHGVVMPVVNLRNKLKLPNRALKLSDQLLVCNVSSRKIAVLVDSVEGAMEYDLDDFTKADPNTTDPDVLKTPEGIVYIYDYEHLLSSRDHQAMDELTQKVTA